MKKTISLLSSHDRCEILQILSECFPNPKSELVFKNPYELWSSPVSFLGRYEFYIFKAFLYDAAFIPDVINIRLVINLKLDDIE